MGVQNPPSPLLYGPNSKATNAQQGEILPNGTYVGFNGPKNYVSYGNFANGLATGWSAVGIAALTNGLPTTVGSGGTAFTSANGGRAAGANTTAPAVTSSGALTNGFSLNLATSGAGTIGDGYISQAYAVDVEDLGKVLNISLSYKVASGTPNMSGTSANTYALAIYDLFNNAWIYPAGAFNFIQVTGTGSFTGTFQTPINMTSFQLFIYSPVAPTAASSLLLNSIVVGPQKQVNGPAMTDWTAYTPTFTGFGTPTNINFYSRRVGDSLEIEGYFTSGANTAVQPFVTLGYNGVNGNVLVDTTKISPSGVLGSATSTQVSSTFFGLTVLGSGSSTNNITFGAQTTTTTGANVISSTSAILGASGVYVLLNAKVPIVGWSSNSSMSADSDTRDVVCQVTSTSTQSIGSATYVGVTGFGTPNVDTHGAWSANAYTVPVTGRYKITFKNYWANTSLTGAGNIQSVIQVGGANTFIALNPTGAASTVQYRSGIADTFLQLNAGQVISFAVYQDSGTTLSLNSVGNSISVSINRQSGPAVIAATESVNGLYTDTSGASITANGQYVFGTKVRDSHAAYSAGVLTIPISGMYTFNVQMTTAATTVVAGNNFQLLITRNGTSIGILNDAAWASQTTTLQNAFTIEYPCLAGDLIKVGTSSSIAMTANTTVGYNNFSWARQGN